MFIRRAAAMLLVDAEMALRSGAWLPTRGTEPTIAMSRLETVLASPASDDDVSDALDRLYAIMGRAMMLGDLVLPGYEQFELADVLPGIQPPEHGTAVVAANDSAPPLAMAA